MPLLRNLVGHVFFLRAEKKMLGVDAGPHIAAMTDQQAAWNRAVIHHP
jgi:hypothetical protein